MTDSNDPWSNPHVTVDSFGRLYSYELHREGFPFQLWGEMQRVGYTQPPQYLGTHINTLGMNYYEVSLFIPNIAPMTGPQIHVVSTGGSYQSACDTAAWRALQQFCAKHNMKKFGTPAGTFPITPNSDPGESSSSAQGTQVMDPDALYRYVDNLNHMVENMAFSYGAMTSAAQELAQDRNELCDQVDQHVITIGDLEEQIADLQEGLQEEEELEVEWVPMQNPPSPPPPAELPEQGNSGLDDVPGEPIENPPSEGEGSVMPAPRVHRPCYGWISETSSSEEELSERNEEESVGNEEEEEPEEREFYSDNDNSE